MQIQAARLIDLGLPIIPICSHDHTHTSDRHNQICKCPGKTPLIRGWQSRSVTTQEHLNTWVTQFKTFNIGMPLGSASGYCGIDVDGVLGEEFLQELSKGDLPATWEFSTRAGRRLLYTLPPGTPTQKYIMAAEGGGHEECAILADGQQTVMPPSIHHEGSTYQWLEGRSPWDIDCAPAPKWIMELIKVEDTFRTRPLPVISSNPLDNLEDEFGEFLFSTAPPPESKGPAKVKGQKQGIRITDELLTSPIPDGQRDNTMTAIVGHYCANRDLRRLGKEFILDICLKHNQEYCIPPLESSAIEDKVNYFFDLEGMKDASFKAMGTEKKTFLPSEMVPVVLKYLKDSNIVLHFDQGSQTYYYTKTDQGPWIPTRNITLINRWIREAITASNLGAESWDKSSYIEEVRKTLEESYTEAFKQFSDFDIGAHSEELSKYIVVNNGMLDWEEGELLEWDPEYKTTIAFDLDYEPEATCPRFQKYLIDWLPDPDVRKVMQQYLGYCLIPNTKFRKALFLYGKGRNGKSMLLEFVQDFFGDNKATLSYDALFQRFGPANLRDKVVNIYDDTTVAFAKDTGIAKNLIAGGTISAEFKGRDHFTFTNVARFIFSAQETPRTADYTEAWYDRWMFIHFPNKFRASNKIKTQIENDLAEEKAGIFNWMVEGLKDLMEADEFHFSQAIMASSADYRSQNDGVARFVDMMCTEGSGTNLNLLYKVYSVWSEYEGLRPLSKRNFTSRLEDLGYDKRKGYIDGKSGQTYIENLMINKQSEEYQENILDYSIASQNM